MTIALLAHSTEKELMVQFCIAYSNILKQHRLLANESTGESIATATGLDVWRLFGEKQNGARQAACCVGFDEIDLVLFFRDHLKFHETEAAEADLIWQCDTHIIPIATNIGTAEVLIHGLDRGDLEWRDNVRNLQQWCV